MVNNSTTILIPGYKDEWIQYVTDIEKQVPPTRKQQISFGSPHLWSRREGHAQRVIWSHFSQQSEGSDSKHSCTQTVLHHQKSSPHIPSLLRPLLSPQQEEKSAQR